MGLGFPGGLGYGYRGGPSYTSVLPVLPGHGEAKVCHSQQGLGIPVPKDTQPTGTMFHIRINKRTVQKPAAHQLWAGMGSREQGHTQGRPKGEAIAQSGEQRRAWVRARVCILPAGGGSFSAAVG